MIFEDNRGALHSLKNLSFRPKEILVSQSSKNVFRGLHMSPYAKFIYVSHGKIRDFYWYNGTLTEKTLCRGDSLYVPANAAHGFYTVEETEAIYLLDGEFDPHLDRNIYWQTPEFSIPPLNGVILSQKDRDAKYYDTYDYIVLGASGFLGQQCVKYLRLAGKKVLESSIRLEKPSEILEQIQKSGARYVICAAGISGRPTIDWCEANEDETYKINYLAILNLMEVCKDVHLTIFGSGAVYTGLKALYTEDDPPDFDSKVYSKYRIMLEKMLRPNVLYLRIMYPCTFDGHPKCFYQKMLGRRGSVHSARVSITAVPDLFPHISTLVENGTTGIYNFVADGAVSLTDLVNDPSPNSECPRGNYELSAKKLGLRIPLIKINSVIERRCGSS
jgi:dTDP-4-dehydrorhamnose reductase/dTDP-4-dehydrorhamnose 3,5-epimerase-like enzyme